MKELVQQQQILKRHLFLCNFFSFLHSWILPNVGALMMGFFFNNKLVFSIGCGILFYAYIAGLIFIIPYFDKCSSELREKQIKAQEHLKHIETVNQSLDERRDLMLFDHDYKYWKILETLTAQ